MFWFHLVELYLITARWCPHAPPMNAAGKTRGIKDEMPVLAIKHLKEKKKSASNRLAAGEVLFNATISFLNYQDCTD